MANLKIKVWIPFEIEVSKAKVKQSMKRVRDNFSMAKTEPVHMEDVVNDLTDNGIVEIPSDYTGLGLKFDSEWHEPFTEDEI